MRLFRWSAGIILFFVSLALVLYATGYLEIEVANADPRPKGSLYDVEALKRRDDVNVLFVLVDTLRAERLSSYGYHRETSPTLDYMAQTGLRFGRHLAQSSWTKCSMASLWTGLYPQRTGVLRSNHALPDEALSAAEVFRDAGFRTAGLWRNGWVAPNFGFDQGFEVYEKPSPQKIGPNVRVANPHIVLEGTDSEVVDSAVEFIRVHGRERWFLYLHLMDVHQYLYDTGTKPFGAAYSDIYDSSVLHTDGVVGRMLTHLVDQGLLDRTLVVLAADHGEAFGERGIEGHAREVYRETTEIPLVIGFPFRLEPGLVVDSRTSNVDVWPTVLELLGLPPLPQVDGVSRVREIFGAAPGEGEAEPAYAHLERAWGRTEGPARTTVAVSLGPYRYVLQINDDVPKEPRTESLFDASTDPLEMNDISSAEPGRVEDLRALAHQYLELESADWDDSGMNVELDENQAAQLRALGYGLP